MRTSPSAPPHSNRAPQPRRPAPVGVDQPRIEAAVAEILAAIGEDPGRAGLASTPERVASAYAEFFAGLGQDPLDHLRDTVPVGDRTGELVLLRDIEFRSVCEHHLLPFLGTAHLAYLPGERIVGLGKLASVVTTLAARPQLQERLTEEIADTLETGLAPRGILVVLDASHGCVTTRGPRQTHSSTVTMASRGDLALPVARSEIIALIGGTQVVR
ncbi:GTP cyclohydrolase I [Cryobacterium sp. TMN-39-2]|uniref:GTP cyclohydrolase 1 n=1 Tax=Cryobacterium zongtaii TaxID=1259217 RepID=A0A2S3ZBZ6_9MICO|nr:GTP cyclohydrolase I FolE [Cryobacterium sp. LW097]POH63417.1 GTP cyclohydrolase I [Cryobacterium zongtaii]TFC42437.1 GTP cyclohydrolase I [Cryobacterium sp. TMN-39-2]TFC52698.1 GTP cyclohydrolase I [Cryobacterium sp. TMB3-1-2]TFC68356.1 GTP cyclohydrolase I [Cryobacterium sp. TMB3-15]TFC74944.1 GTP cyclohydrolase I [Cryobacterium sp. TMB3-10]TFC92844.1 GTP cyclohydrolase I [Cryobacterium sp. TMT4-31]TFD38396.1 GTP cyclohydrolase I [Cryobacterium sp. TMB3-12]